MEWCSFLKNAVCLLFVIQVCDAIAFSLNRKGMRVCLKAEINNNTFLTGHYLVSGRNEENVVFEVTSLLLF